jgi:pentatricopeptide repeat protein
LYRKTPLDDDKGRLLVDVLFQLAQASTKAESMEAIRQLQALPLVSASVAPSPSEQAILERVIRAAALSGLEDFAWNYTVTGFLNWDMLPSIKAQDALSSALRRAGKIELFKEFLSRSGTALRRKESASSSGQKSVSLTSFNMFLACLCEEKTPRWHRKREATGRVEVQLNEAFSWLANDYARTCLGVVPDAVSYSTVMHAAASMNRTIADATWTLMLQQNIRPDIFAYNARLSAILSAPKSQQSNQDALFLWDSQISIQSTLLPDQYTLDLILPLLLRAGRIGEVEDLLDRFVSQNSESIVSNAFAAFLVSLIQDGELASARAIFEMYMAPSLSSVVAAIAGEMRIVRPRTRHFNILLEGYRKHWQLHAARKMTASSDTKKKDDRTLNHVVKEAWDLFELMQKSSAKVDAYTTTTMMGLCRTSEEIAELLYDAFANQQVACTGVVARAAISSFGSLSDPSSACWFCFKFYGHTRRASVRTLNVLMGAFAESAAADISTTLSMENSAAARHLEALVDTKRRKSDSFILLDGLKCQEAAASLLETMIEQDNFLPKPDSQTFCLAASTLQHGRTDPSVAVELFRQATRVGITADGRFINAIFRCFGDDVDAAISVWKGELRSFCLSQVSQDGKNLKTQRRLRDKNLFAAYNGLLFVCGRARRSDIAVRVVYAMKKEGLDPSELSLNCYNSGKRKGSSTKELSQSWLTKKLKFADPYESLLYVECMKYDKNDRRRFGEKRVRIIV